MTDLLPFVHPPHDPPPEVEERVRRRVLATARRRRARQRVLVAGPAVALVALAGVAVAQRPEPEQVDTATTTTVEPADPAAGLDVEPNTFWYAPTLAADERTLTFPIAPSCETGPYRHDVVETATEVVVGIEGLPPPPPTPEAACASSLEDEDIVVVLDEPLGDRPVYDGLSPRPKLILRRNALVEVTYVPDGFVAEEPQLDLPAELSRQTFTRPGSTWSFAVNQARTDAGFTGFDDPPGTPITVNGQLAEHIDGPLQKIQLTLGDLDVSVWATGPGADLDELVAVAEGLRLPD